MNFFFFEEIDFLGNFEKWIELNLMEKITVSTGPKCNVTSGLEYIGLIFLGPRRGFSPQPVARERAEGGVCSVPSLRSEAEPRRRPAATTMGGGEGKSRKRRSSPSSGA